LIDFQFIESTVLEHGPPTITGYDRHEVVRVPLAERSIPDQIFFRQFRHIVKTDFTEPDVFRIDHDIHPAGTLSEAFCLGNPHTGMQSSLLGDAAEFLKNLLSLVIIAAGAFAFAIVGADEDLSLIGHLLFFHVRKYLREKSGEMITKNRDSSIQTLSSIPNRRITID
jgi:hypothetical protein